MYEYLYSILNYSFEQILYAKLNINKYYDEYLVNKDFVLTGVKFIYNNNDNNLIKIDVIDYFSKKISTNLGKKHISFNSNYTKLYQHHWLGNVRELRNLVERVIILSDGSAKEVESIINDSINLENVENSSNFLDFDSPLKTAREQFEKEYLLHQLKKNGSNISKTSESIGMERSALHRKLTSLGIAYKK